MFWIALELSIPKIEFNIMLSLPVKKLDAFKFDGVAESDNTASLRPLNTRIVTWITGYERPSHRTQQFRVSTQS